MIENGLNNDFLEIGEIIDEKSIPKENLQIKIKSNKGDDISLQLQEFESDQVKEMKKKLFKEHIDGNDSFSLLNLKGGSQIRLLFNGRLLQDGEKIQNIKFEQGSMITAFISPRVVFTESSDSEDEKKQEKNPKEGEKTATEVSQTQIANDGLGIRHGDERGFDLFKSQGYSVKRDI